MKPHTGPKIIEGDALTVLARIPTKSVQCVITSPPYWGTRDYRVKGQIGLEPRVEEYIANLVAIFREVRRVLRDDGVLWVNIGDVYASGNRKYRAADKKYPQRALTIRPATPSGTKPKDLIGVPWKLAFALRDDGWFLRTEIIWQKPNAIPESVRDRPARGHEYLFLFSKSKQYNFSRRRLERGFPELQKSVWQIPTTRARVGGHHASFPAKLVTPCVVASSSQNDIIMDPFCGTGTVGRVCKAEQRRFLGIEINPSYVRAAKIDLLTPDNPTKHCNTRA